MAWRWMGIILYCMLLNQPVTSDMICSHNVCIDNSTYEPRSRPHHHPIVLSAGFNLLAIHSLSPKSRNVNINVLTVLKWKDNRVKVKGRSSASVPLDHRLKTLLWTPDIHILNLRDFTRWTQEQGHRVMYAQMDKDGNTIISKSYIAEVQYGCNFSLQCYPFFWADCTYKIASASLSSDYLQVVTDGSMDLVKHLYFQPEEKFKLYYELIKNGTEMTSLELKNERFSVGGFTFVMETIPNEAMVTNYSPCYILICSIFFSFLIDPKASIPARTSICIVILLALITVLNGINNSDGEVIRGVNAAAIWVLCCIVFGMLILLINILIFKIMRSKYYVMVNIGAACASLVLFVFLNIGYWVWMNNAYPSHNMTEDMRYDPKVEDHR